MSHHFYLQNGARRSAQAFPISLAPGAKFSEAKESFSEMLGTSTDQIIRLTTADGHIILPGQTIPEEALILEVSKGAFDKLTGSGTSAPMGSMMSQTTFWSTIFPSIVVFVLFSGFAIILGGLASASHQCKSDDVAAWMFTNLFAWGSNTAGSLNSGISLEWICGLSLSLFWTIIMLELFLCIIPAAVLLFAASSFSADTKGSWAYVITCSLNTTTALLCIMAYTVVPGAYYAHAIDRTLIPVPLSLTREVYIADVPADYVKAVEVMAAGVIILLVANFAWIYSQACGKMIPEEFKCCAFGSSKPAQAPYTPYTGIVPSHSPMTPARPTVMASM